MNKGDNPFKIKQVWCSKCNKYIPIEGEQAYCKKHGTKYLQISYQYFHNTEEKDNNNG